MSRDRPETIAERYDRDAPAYRELWAPILRSASLRLLPELAGRGARRILDVGAGVGALLADVQAAERDALVVAVDRSRGMLALAQPGFPRAVMDAQKLAVATGAVDGVLLVFMLFHLPSPAAALREARRVLRAGGRAVALTWGGELESRATRIWTECLDRAGAAPLDPEVLVRHQALDSAPKLAALLREARFGAVRAWEEELTTVIEREKLVRLRTSVGANRRRYESLDAAARAACVEEARRRLGTLDPRDFIARCKLVYAVAQA